MKPNHVAMLAAAGMLLSSVTVWSLTPPGGFHGGGATAEVATTEASATAEATAAAATEGDASKFTVQGTLAVEGRLGKAKVAAGTQQFVMLEVKAGEAAKGRSAAPVNLTLVIDRSGSMRGSRIANAIKAATAAVERLHEGDTVSVVTFDTQVVTVVPPTSMSEGSRDGVNRAIRSIALGGDTCISCGIEQGLTLLAQTSGKVNRMIVLSDGDANHGIKDLPGFRAEAQRARDRGVTITTIGVDVDYNEKVLAAIAQESNGRHYFVANDEALARAFEQETEALTSTVASGAEVTIELPPGVELDRVFDRSFRRAGNTVIVPLGAFAASDVKTVLLRVRLRAQAVGPLPIAKIEVAYKDLASGQPAKVTGALAAEGVPGPAQASELDPLVASRVARSETAQTLKEANVLFEQGNVEEAKRRIATQQEVLRSVGDKVKAAAPAKSRRAVSKDIDSQLAALDDSGFATKPSSPGGFASPPAAAAPASRAGKGAVRKNQEEINRFGF